MKKRMLLTVLAALAAIASLPAHAKAPKDQLYIEVSALGNLDYFYDHKMGMEMVGKELGVKTEYVGPAEYDMNAMVAAFEQAIAKKPDGLVVVGFEPSLNSIVDKAVSQGIPVVTVDADLPGSKRMAFVGTGNYNAGVVGGTKLANLIGGKGKVAIMLKPGQSNLEERVAGYKSALSKFKDIEIVQLVDTQSDPNQAAQGAAALLQKYPDLAGIACVEAAGGAGAATAVREAKKVGKVKIVAMDRGNEVLDAIKEGVISASVAQQTALMPYYAVQIMYNLNNSKVAITSDNKAAGVLGIPAVVDTGAIIVDSSNYKFFKR
ncbi:MAG TPA: substrate-binding domain-containing protein [Anaeromyxobacter sp.]|nr:substrate-binding domain-containing protein [Anaeromyxobacter sp.]HVP59405.1 substrate-binding domain-containing protein [Myxococcaceae bacterium]